MFISLPDYEARIPKALLPPLAQCWRALSLSLNTPWFVMSARFDDERDFINTFLLSTDRDVVSFIDSLNGDVTSLLCLVPPLVGEQVDWQAHAIREIWTASDPEESGGECVVFVADDGSEISGIYGLQESIKRRRKLLAKIAIEVPHSTDADDVSEDTFGA